MFTKTQQSVFIFNSEYRTLAEMMDNGLPVYVDVRHVLRYFAMVFGLVALPMSLVIILLVQIAGYSIWLLLPIELLAALLISFYYAFRWYRRWTALAERGQVIYGEIIHSDALPAFTRLSNATTTRFYYRFFTPDNERVVDQVELNYAAQRMPDGRKYPDVGARVAVLYASPKDYALL